MSAQAARLNLRLSVGTIQNKCHSFKSRTERAMVSCDLLTEILVNYNLPVLLFYFLCLFLLKKVFGVQVVQMHLKSHKILSIADNINFFKNYSRYKSV